MLGCRSVLAFVRISVFVLLCSVSSARNWTLSIADFGAVPDGKTSNTAAFKKAVFAISCQSGGTLVVPPGKWLTGPFNLTSNMTLFLEKDAEILASTDLDEWPLISPLPSYGQGRDHPGPRRVSFIMAVNKTGVAIKGNNGTINGQGPFWWERHQSFSSHMEEHTRGRLIELLWSSHIKIEDVTLRDSPFWTVHPVYSEYVEVRRLTIINDYLRGGGSNCARWMCSGCNTDGFDPDSTTHVLVEDSYFNVGDDGIAIKSGWDCFGNKYGKPSQNITIRNLTVVSPTSAGVCIGSEMSGGVSDVHVSNSNFISCSTGIRLKTNQNRGAYIKNITYENIRMSGSTSAAIQINAFYGSRNPSCGKSHSLPIVDNIKVSNVLIEDSKGLAMDLEGLETSPMTNLFFENVTIVGNARYKCTGATSGSAKSFAPTPPEACGLTTNHEIAI